LGEIFWRWAHFVQLKVAQNSPLQGTNLHAFCQNNHIIVHQISLAKWFCLVGRIFGPQRLLTLLLIVMNSNVGNKIEVLIIKSCKQESRF
jgi:hypothetical protein